MAPRVFRAPDGPAAREARRPHFALRRASKPARALRSLRHPPHRRRCIADVWLGASSRSLAWPRRPWASQPGPPVTAGALHASGAWALIGGSICRPETQLWLSTSNFARNSSMAHSNIEFTSLELQRFWGISKNDRDKLRAIFIWRWCGCRPLRPSALLASIGALARCPAPPPTGPAARPSGLSGTLHADGGGGFAALEAGCWRVGGVSDL